MLLLIFNENACNGRVLCVKKPHKWHTKAAHRYRRFFIFNYMELITRKEGQYLPDSLNDLAQFVLVGRDQLAMVRAGIKALDKLDVAEGVRRQKREEAQMLAEALLDAEVKIGEILKGMPKATGGHWEEKRESKIGSAADFIQEKQTKNDAIKSLGFNQTQVERFQKLAENKDIVEQIKQEAREADDLPTRTAVLNTVKAKEKEEKLIRMYEKQDREIFEANAEVQAPEKLFSVEPGQIWKLGRHTLICGSIYDAGYVDADAVITDPPYGIDYTPDWKKWNGEESNFNKIQGDAEEFDPRPFFDYDTILLFGANYFTRHLPTSGGWLCWDKRTKEELDDMIGSPFELAWFRSKYTKKSAIMLRILHGGVVNADSQFGNNEKRLHPTQKPIILFEQIIERLTIPNDTVLDPFCGSGTTLIACERTGRTCIAYEIEPQYCEVILNRFYSLTNIMPCQE